MKTGQLRTGGVTQQHAFLGIALSALLLAAVASWSDLLLIVAGQVIPGWAASAALLLTVLTFKRVHTALYRTPTTLAPPHRRSALPRLVPGLLAAAAALGVAFGGASDLLGDANYLVLQPAGPGGCTAVVRETSFLVIGDGEVYAVGRTGIAWGKSGSWRVDDGYRPVAAGTYTLHWHGSDGTFRPGGTSTDPVLDSDIATLDC
ncbi:hypothetical protein [Streptomyces sp. NPDC050738]|uniref:hypothetical protein n=1 Tax=Streptomyces sp. NPDC050738 TaxID=3154744 RepID=UPI00343D46AC